MDYPNLRKSKTCPFCRKAKDIGTIACWPCYRSEDLRNGEDACQTAILEHADRAALGKTVGSYVPFGRAIRY